MGLALAAAGLLLAARAGLSAPDAPSPPPPDPAFYDYDARAPFPVTETPFGREGDVTITRLTYPSPVVTPYPVNNTVTAYLFLPPGPGPHPAMVVLHEWHAGTTRGGFALCRVIARAQVAALLVVEPYSLNRRAHSPNGPDPEILSGNVPEMRDSMRQAVLDARRGLDYLARRPDVDPARLGAAGISLGGILAGLLSGVDSRVTVAMTIVGGADFARGFWNGALTRRFRGEIRRRGYTFESFRAAMAPVEAATWLGRRGFDPDNALVIAGRYDLVVGPAQTEALGRAFGGSPLVWVNTGHYGAVLSAKPAGDLGVRFLRARWFGEDAPFRRPDTLPSRTIKLGLLLGGREGVSPAAAYQVVNLDRAGRFSLDGQVTLHGLSAALSARIGPLGEVGLEFPLFHSSNAPRPFVMLNVTL